MEAHKSLSTNARCRDGAVCSSDEGTVMVAERRHGTVRLIGRTTGNGRTLLGQAKPYDIPKRWVWEAYKRVKANRGAAGVDEQSIEVFEADLQSNLYKLWNRMSSAATFHRRSSVCRSTSATAERGR